MSNSLLGFQTEPTQLTSTQTNQQNFTILTSPLCPYSLHTPQCRLYLIFYHTWPVFIVSIIGITLHAFLGLLPSLPPHLCKIHPCCCVELSIIRSHCCVDFHPVNPHNVFIHPAEDSHHEAIMNGWHECTGTCLLVNTCTFLLEINGLEGMWMVSTLVDAASFPKWLYQSTSTPPAVTGYSCQHWTFLHTQRKDLGWFFPFPTSPLRAQGFSWCKYLLCQALEYRQTRQSPCSQRLSVWWVRQIRKELLLSK